MKNYLSLFPSDDEKEKTENTSTDELTKTTKTPSSGQEGVFVVFVSNERERISINSSLTKEKTLEEEKSNNATPSELTKTTKTQNDTSEGVFVSFVSCKEEHISKNHGGGENPQNSSNQEVTKLTKPLSLPTTCPKCGSETLISINPTWHQVRCPEEPCHFLIEEHEHSLGHTSMSDYLRTINPEISLSPSNWIKLQDEMFERAEVLEREEGLNPDDAIVRAKEIVVEEFLLAAGTVKEKERKETKRKVNQQTAR